MLTGSRSTNIMHTIFLVKLVGLIAYGAWHFNLFNVGERSSLAADDKAGAESPAPAEEGKGESTKLASKGDEASLTKAPTKERKGFLEGLLDLPDLDVTTAQKDEIGRYLSLVERAKQQVEDRLKVLNQRAGQLKGLEGSIDEKLRLLEEERKFFTTTIQREKEIQEERLKTLVDLYANMEPKKAAPVFETLDKDLVVALFKKMKNKQVTKILEVLTPARSKELTEYFGRIGSAREYELLKEMNKSLRDAFDGCKGLPQDTSSSETSGKPA